MNTRIAVYIRPLLLAFLVLFLFTPSPTHAAEENDLQIQLQSTPEFNVIKPNFDSQFSIVVKDNKGQPVKDVELAFTLESPAAKFFPSTDVPRVEGLTLMKSKVFVPDGKLDFGYVFPIRGEYALTVKATPTGNPNHAVEKTLHFTINENPTKVRNVSIFISVLLLLGFATGYILTSRRVAGEVVEV
ncbi:hypothetical protein JCM15765_43770 [Paradesulfitobacterium aromaticivorans]